MSRPATPYDYSQQAIQRSHARVPCPNVAKPRITGLAQRSGFRGEAKNDKDVVDRDKLDIMYIENWSLPLDFYIIFRTMYQVFKPPKTAY
jgi:putative colanic acid biosysnthesis UDP-glucose lipid carrier transferase